MTGDQSPSSSVLPKTPDNRTVEERSPTQTGKRSASGKIANLRAAFEAKNQPETTIVRKFSSSEPPSSDDKSRIRAEEATAEIAKLKNELSHERELRQVFEEKHTQLKNEVEELRNSTASIEGAGTSQQDQELVSNSIPAKDQTNDGAAVRSADSSEAVDLEKHTIQPAQQEIAQLTQQLADLKKTIVASTRVPVQTSDAEFAQELSLLHHEIQNWIVQNFRRANTSVSVDELCKRLDTVAEQKHLNPLKSLCRTWDGSDKLAFYQSVALCYIMEIFDDQTLFGLPASDWRRSLRKVVEGMSTTLSRSDFNIWRSTTFDLLSKTPGLAESIDSAASGLGELICITLGALTDTQVNHMQLSSLVTILKRATALSHQFRLQRSEFHFLVPSAGTQLYIPTMEDISDLHESTNSRFVKYSTFPAVSKVLFQEEGAEHSENTIVKARVLCTTEYIDLSALEDESDLQD